MRIIWLKLFIFFGSIYLTVEDEQTQIKHNFYWEYYDVGLSQTQTTIRPSPNSQKKSSYQKIVFDPARGRLSTLMRGFYEDARKRTRDLNSIRFVVEETYQYEMGYLMHELYDKYKKLVEQFNKGEYNRSLAAKTNYTFRPYKVSKDLLIYGNEKIDRTEFAQQLYFDIYHISNMIHEITRKYDIRSTKRVPGHFDYAKAGKWNEYQKNLAAEERKHRKLIKVEANKLLKKVRDERIRTKSSESYGLAKSIKHKQTNLYIRDRMKEQGWQHYNLTHRNYTNPWRIWDYGWDVPLPPQTQGIPRPDR